MRLPSRGFTLVEILVAAAVLVFAFLPIVGTVVSANRQSQQAGDYGTGITLSSFVAEEVRLANWENPHLQDGYLADAGAMSVKPVTGGGSPFFAAIEDDARPWGRLTRTEDSAIVEQMQPLYSLLKDFDTGLEVAVRPLETGGDVMDLGVKTSWTDFQQKGREHRMRVTVGRLEPRPCTPEALLDRALADSAIREAMFPDRSGTLESAAAADGVDLALVRAVGELALIGKSMGESVPRDVEEIRELGVRADAASDTAEKARLTRRRVALLERLTAQRLIAMEYTLGKARVIQERLATDASPATGGRIRRVVDDIQPLLPFQMRVAQEIVEVETLYRQLFEPPLGPALPPRQRLRIALKLVDVHKLRLLTRGPRDLSFLQAFLDFVARMEEGRNQNVVELAEAEKVRARTWDDLLENYQRPASVEAYARFPDAIFPAYTLMRARAAAAPASEGDPAAPRPGL